MKYMVKVNTLSLMEGFTMVTGLMVREMVKDRLFGYAEIFI